MTQSKIMSVIEVATNISTGFLINWTANLFVLPAFGFPVTGGQAFQMGLIFTVIAIARSWVVRRAFNRLQGVAA
jgi:hypothetical protein